MSTRLPRTVCPFCERIARGDYEGRYGNVVWFEPLNPVTAGHLLFVPMRHAANAAIDPQGAGDAMEAAAVYVRDLYGNGINANLITSIGPAATQSIWHTHVHVVPRYHADELHLPWTGQVKS